MYQYHRFKKLYFALIIIIGVGLLGIFGYSFIEGYSFGEALFMTIITISTVGFQEVRPLSEEGRYFTSFLIIFSIGTFAYALSATSSYIIDGEFRRHLHELKKVKKIRKLENHIIICGYGRNGKQIAQELKTLNQPFVLIEKFAEVIQEAINDKCQNYIKGDATDDEVLIQAGIKRARGLIATLPEDSENVFVVLTAREMKRDLLIISRASKDSSDKKLRMAGADNVVMPDKVGGSHMASLVMKPDVVEFFNLLNGQDDNISLEEITYESLPKEFRDKSIQDLQVRKRSGANIIGLKNLEGKYILNPTPETVISEGSKLFVLGMKNQIDQLMEWK